MLDVIANALSNEVGKTIATTVIFPLISYGIVKLFNGVRMIGAIYKTIMPNGGSGLVDRVKNMEEQVTIIRGRERWNDTTNETSAVFECDATGQCVHVTKSLAMMFGMTPDEMRGYGWLDAMIDSTERDRARVAWEKSRENRMPYRDTYRVHNRETGERFFAQACAHIITDKTGKVLAIVGGVEKLKTIRQDNGTPDRDLSLPSDATPLKRTA